MKKFINENLDSGAPYYYYLVSIFLSTFGEDEGKSEPFTHEQIFKGHDLLKCRAQAVKYWRERLEGLSHQGKYFLPFAGFKEFVLGKNAAFSVTLSLVEYYNENEWIEWPLLGEDEQTQLESREVEAAVLSEHYRHLNN